MFGRRCSAPVCAIAALFVIMSASHAAGATYQVGPGKQYPRLADLPLLAPGDVVEISPGIYREAMRWTSSGTAEAPITIRGVGAPRPIIDGTGVGVSGVLPQPRALFQVEGDHIVVENIEFVNAHNDVGNGSGIRVLFGRSTVIRNVRISACDMGIMANGHDDLLVEHSEIASNGAATGAYSHNVYIADGGTTTFRFNYIHDSLWGLNFKSRSHFTQLLYNHIAHSADGEISLVDSVSTDQANSHALMLGNLVVSKVRSPWNNQAKFIDFGQDTGIPHRGVLYLVHNTLVAAAPEIEFLWATSSEASIVAEHNIFFGSNRIVGMPGGGSSGARNWLPSSATIPSTWTESITGTAPGFVNPAIGDYHLIIDSAAVDRAIGPTPYVDGFGVARWATPEWEYVASMQRAPRNQSGASHDLGAFETFSDVPPPPPSGGSQVAFVGLDTTTKGTWQGVYGSQGYVLANVGTSLPAGMTVVPNGHASWTWTGTTSDARALQPPGGGSRVAATWYAAGSFVIDVQPGDTATHRLALYLLDWDNSGRAQAVELLDGVSSAVLDTRTLSGFGGGQYAIWEVQGPVRVRVTRTAGPNAVVSAVFLDPVGSVPPPGGSATAVFAGTDSTTQGSWPGVYGTQGYVLAQEGTSLPAGATMTATGQQSWAWAGTTSDIRALRKTAGPDRIASTWYGSSFTMALNVGDGQPHRVALYVVDWDTTTRGEQIEVVDGASGAVLDTRTVTAFAGGQYWVWTVTGAVQFRVTRTAGANAVVSAVFIDPGSGSAPPPAAAATFRGTDATTKGNWRGVYGTNAYVLAQDGTSVSTGLTVSASGQASWTWEATTSDPRALQRATSSGRVAATWFGSAFTIDVGVSDSQARTVALYVLDWDSGGRQQTVEVLDAATGAVVDTRTITAFTGGQYWIWTVRSSVRFRVMRSAGANAVVSAVFIDLSS